MPRSYYYSRVGGVVWFVAPKCGTRTTLEACSNIGFKFMDRVGRKPLPDSYDFSFSFVRNPYDRLVSCYTQKIVEPLLPEEEFSKITPRKRLNAEKPNFRDFVRYVLSDEVIQLDVHWDTLHNLMPVTEVDFIGKVENFQEDFNSLCDKIGISRQELPHNNKSKHKHYTEYYDDETREIVAEKYAKDIEYFGYEFGG